MLPQSYRAPAAVFYGDGNQVIIGAITKSGHDGLARLSSGFGTLVRDHGIEEGDILVVRMRELEGAYHIRIFKVLA
jgi:predicted RNA-binding protein with TRAM domain